MHTTKKISISAINAATDQWERISLEDADDQWVGLTTWVDLSAEDLGCEPGDKFLVELLDLHNTVVESGEFIAG